MVEASDLLRGEVERSFKPRARQLFPKNANAIGNLLGVGPGSLESFHGSKIAQKKGPDLLVRALFSCVSSAYITLGNL